MVFNFTTDAGVSSLEGWLKTRSYIVGFTPSQADVAVYKALTTTPNPAQFPNISRWARHISTWKNDFSELPGDSSKPYTAYGPDAPQAQDVKNLAEGDNDDDIDLFGSDDEEEDAEAIRIREERLTEYRKKKAGAKKAAAKSIITLDVKPWDDETDMIELEANVRAIEMDGLLWGASKFVPIGYGIKKLQINVVVEDEKVSLDDLQQQIEADEDHVQSIDVQAMQKL